MEFKLVDFDPDNKPEKGNAEEVELKEGDRVWVSTKSGYTSLVGKTGMVYAVDPKAGGDVLVKLDGWNDGHSGCAYLEAMGRTVEEGSNWDKWIFREDDLYKIEWEVRDGKPQKGNEAKVKFKIGDHVKVTQHGENCGQKGTIVDVCNFLGDNLYLIRFDDQKRGLSGSFFYTAARRANPRPEAETGYWILREDGMKPVCDGEDAKNGAKKPARRIVVIEITDDGAKARYFNGGKIPAKESEVRRYYKDKPNDELAAIHAVSKLFGWVAGEPKEDFEAVNKIKDRLVEVEKCEVIALESVGEALYKLRQIMK